MSNINSFFNPYTNPYSIGGSVSLNIIGGTDQIPMLSGPQRSGLDLIISFSNPMGAGANIPSSPPPSPANGDPSQDPVAAAHQIAYEQGLKPFTALTNAIASKNDALSSRYKSLALQHFAANPNVSDAAMQQKTTLMDQLVQAGKDASIPDAATQLLVTRSAQKDAATMEMSLLALYGNPTLPPIIRAAIEQRLTTLHALNQQFEARSQQIEMQLRQLTLITLQRDFAQGRIPSLQELENRTGYLAAGMEPGSQSQLALRAHLQALGRLGGPEGEQRINQLFRRFEILTYENMVDTLTRIDSQLPSNAPQSQEITTRINQVRTLIQDSQSKLNTLLQADPSRGSAMTKTSPPPAPPPARPPAPSINNNSNTTDELLLGILLAALAKRNGNTPPA